MLLLLCFFLGQLAAAASWFSLFGCCHFFEVKGLVIGWDCSCGLVRACKGGHIQDFRLVWTASLTSYLFGKITNSSEHHWALRHTVSPNSRSINSAFKRENKPTSSHFSKVQMLTAATEDVPCIAPVKAKTGDSDEKRLPQSRKPCGIVMQKRKEMKGKGMDVVLSPQRCSYFEAS